MSSRTSGYWVASVFISLVGAICFSTKAIFVKLAYRDSTVDAITLLALRMLFSLPFFVGSAWFYSRKTDNVRFNTRQWLSVAAVGILGYYVSSLLDFWGLQYVSAGIERLVLFVYPTFVLLFSLLWFNQKVARIQWLAVAITYFGLVVAFISESQVQIGRDFYLGSLLILACAVTYASYIVGSGKLIPMIGAMKFNSYAMSFAAAAVLSHFFLFGKHTLFDLPAVVYLYSFLMAIVSTVIPSYLVSASIKRLGANNTAIIASIGPVSTIVQAYYLLDETISLLQALGTALILLGILLITWKKTSLEAVQ